MFEPQRVHRRAHPRTPGPCGGRSRSRFCGDSRPCRTSNAAVAAFGLVWAGTAIDRQGIHSDCGRGGGKFRRPRSGHRWEPSLPPGNKFPVRLPQATRKGEGSGGREGGATVRAVRGQDRDRAGRAAAREQGAQSRQGRPAGEDNNSWRVGHWQQRGDGGGRATATRHQHLWTCNRGLAGDGSQPERRGWADSSPCPVSAKYRQSRGNTPLL